MGADKFINKEDLFFSPICNSCKFHISGITCDAFEEGIPDEILLGDNNHSEPLLTQENNIVFEKEE